MATAVTTRSPGSLNPTRQQLDELDALLQRMLDLPVNSYQDDSQVEEEPEGADEAVEEETPPVRAPIAPAPMPALPISYVVVETASPRPLPAASGFEMRSAERPQPPPTPAPTIDPPSAEGEMWVPLRATWQPSPQTWPPLAESWNQAGGVGQALQPDSPKSQAGKPDLREIEIEVPAELMPPPPEPPAIAEEPRMSLPAEDAAPPPSWLLPLVWFNQGFDACLTPLGAPGRWLCSPRGRQLLGAAGLLGLAAAAALAVSAGMGWSW